MNETFKDDRKKIWRERVNLLLPDGLMIILALLMVPIVVIPVIFDLPASIDRAFILGDYTILTVFVIEYISKAALAQNFWKHVTNPWHILDFLVVILPLFDALQIFGELGRSSPILRLLRVVRVLAVGGRAVDRRIKQHALVKMEAPLELPMKVRIVDNNLENIHENVPPNKVGEYLASPTHTWVDFSSVSESKYQELSQILDIPQMLLESELVEDSYPRLDYFESFSMIFARIAELNILTQGTRLLQVTRSGLLVICRGQNIITISRGESPLFKQLLEKTKKYHNREEPLSVSVLYAILKFTLEKDRQIIAVLEHKLMELENIPLGNRPPKFLETTFYLKKEVNQLVPSLLHIKEIVSVITSKRVPLEGFQERHRNLFDILTDEASYLVETAENARDNLLSLIDLYINTTSFELNKVMRIVAVITTFGIVPAIFGLLGSNIVGNPWDIELWQVFLGLVVLMTAMGWIFYRLGWLKI